MSERPSVLRFVFCKSVRDKRQLILVIADRYAYVIGIAEICEKTLDFGNVADTNASVSVDVACLNLKSIGHIVIRNVFLHHCRVCNRYLSVAVRVAE